MIWWPGQGPSQRRHPRHASCQSAGHSWHGLESSGVLLDTFVILRSPLFLTVDQSEATIKEVLRKGNHPMRAHQVCLSIVLLCSTHFPYFFHYVSSVCLLIKWK